MLLKCRHCGSHTFQLIKTYVETYADESIPYGVEYERQQVVCQHCEGELPCTEPVKQFNIDSLTKAILEYRQDHDEIMKEILNSPLQDCSLQHEVMSLMNEICDKFDQLEALGCCGMLSPNGVLEVSGMNLSERPFMVTMTTSFTLGGN